MPCLRVGLQGRTVNFANTVIIMTSNLGSEYLLQAAATRPTSPAEALSVGQLSQQAAKELVMAQVSSKEIDYGLPLLLLLLYCI